MGKKDKGAAERPKVDSIRLGLGVLVVLLIGSNLVFWSASRPTPLGSAGPQAAAASNPGSPAMTPRKAFRIVNGHDHLYMMEHLDRYMKAAEVMGVEKTLFVASSEFTFLGKGSKEKLNDWSTNVVLEAADAYPGKIIPFATLHPNDKDKVTLLEGYMARGIKGLKLYTGHSNFYDRSLYDESMFPVYAFCQEKGLPILWHVNMSKYLDDLNQVLLNYPKLKLLIPHFGVGFWNPQDGTMAALGKMMDTYPNVYVDSSFGTREILVGGLGRVSQFNDYFRDYYEKYQDRIIWGTDMVVTGNSEKTQEWIESVLRACRDVHEQDTYYYWMAAKGSKYADAKTATPYGQLRGLDLSDAILEKVYWTNFHRFLGLPE
ncbi:MAG: amidohydrolase family protein [Candidatus Hydrogenedentes bacterium]|nr:amidohydrolase family protein [Candidatus Hydrogenedentota bacterium]